MTRKSIKISLVWQIALIYLIIFSSIGFALPSLERIWSNNFSETLKSSTLFDTAEQESIDQMVLEEANLIRDLIVSSKDIVIRENHTFTVFSLKRFGAIASCYNSLLLLRYNSIY
jgi:hypothetical protein